MTNMTKKGDMKNGHKSKYMSIAIFVQKVLM